MAPPIPANGGGGGGGCPDANARAAALVSARVAADFAGAVGVLQLSLGLQLGVWAAMRDAGRAVAPQELAAATSLCERYLRELLCSCAAQGYLCYSPDDGDGDGGGELGLGKFALAPGLARAILDPACASFTATPTFLANFGLMVPQLLDAFRTGGGVPFEAYGEHMVAGIAASSQAGYAQYLTQEWIPMLPDIDKILLEGGIIADVACGCGHSSVAMAKGYPKSKVHAIDADTLSVGKARKLVAQEGLEGRVEVHCGLAHDVMMQLDGLRGCCDLVTLLECVHDMHNPIDVLRTARELLKEGRGAVLIADEKVEDTLEAMLPWRDTAPPSNLQLAGPDEDSTNLRARLCYGYSVLACLPQAMANSPSSATGTCMTRSTLARYARAAGWSGAEVVHQTDVWNLYRLLW
eukprot:SM000256S08687  [mRNA]  locus=s256:48588:50174:- [translate_table: standard]